ncbi:MAG: hypothetical protein RLZZ54_414 [Cyanobacteriota bacterium]|jgi:hypothetical protein
MDAGMALQRIYRLIDACCEPHQHLDDCYSSLDEAITDAVAWLEQITAEPQQQWIGVEVCAANGDWRTYRLPMPLLCALPG